MIFCSCQSKEKINALSVFSFTFSGFSLPFSPNFVFIKKQSSGGSGGADGSRGILGTGQK